MAIVTIIRTAAADKTSYKLCYFYILFRISGVSGGARMQTMKRNNMMFNVTHNTIGPMLEWGGRVQKEIVQGKPHDHRHGEDVGEYT